MASPIRPGGAQVNLYADDPGRLAGFYAALGLAERFRFPAEGPAKMVEVALGGLTLGLVARSEMRALAGQPVPNGPAQAEVVLWLDAAGDVDAAADHACGAGGHLLTAPVEVNRRHRSAWVADPEGNPVKFVAFLPQPQPAED